MADIVMAYSLRAPMMAAEQQEIRERAAKFEVEAVVMISGELFTNFVLNSLPQIIIGVGEAHQAPPTNGLKFPKTSVPGEPGLASYLVDRSVAAGFQPMLCYKMKADHGFINVYYQLDPVMRLPMIPIVLNCTTPPMMRLRHCYGFGKAVGDAIRSYPGLKRVAVCGTAGFSQFHGQPPASGFDEEFGRWYLEQLQHGEWGDLIDMPNDELAQAGNRAGEVRAWVAVAGVMHGHSGTVRSYQPSRPVRTDLRRVQT